MNDPIPLTVLTGFLGSGKTTVVAALLRRPELARTAVIVNEFGEIGLDHELIESSDEDLVELSTGCLCCSMRGDLVKTVNRLIARRAEGRSFDRIVLETTGLADPAPIAHALIADPMLRRSVRLHRMVVTIDAVTGLASLDSYEESRRQVALADIFLLTKTDLEASNATLLANRLSAINPDASIARSVFGAIDPSIVIGPAGFSRGRTTCIGGADHDHHAEHRHDDITSLSLRFNKPVHAITLTLFLQALAETYGADLIRVKGLVAIMEAPDSPAVIHGVQHVFHPMRWLDAWPGRDRSSRIVLIGKRLDSAWVEALLETVDEEVAAISGQ